MQSREEMRARLRELTGMEAVSVAQLKGAEESPGTDSMLIVILTWAEAAYTKGLRDGQRAE